MPHLFGSYAKFRSSSVGAGGIVVVVVGAAVVGGGVVEVVAFAEVVGVVAVSPLSPETALPMNRPAIRSTTTRTTAPMTRSTDRFERGAGGGVAATLGNGVGGGVRAVGGAGGCWVGGATMRAVPHDEQKRFPGTPDAPHDVQNQLSPL